MKHYFLIVLLLLIAACNQTPKLKDAKESTQTPTEEDEILVDSVAMKMDTTFYVNGVDAPPGTPEYSFDQYYWAMYDDDFKKYS